MKRFWVAIIILMLSHNDVGVAQNHDEWVYYSGIETGTFEVYRIRPDGTDAQQLTFDSGEDYFQGVSPDGQWLIVQSIEGENFYLYRIHLETGQSEQITSVDSRFESWSPDRQTFLYTVYRGGGQELWQMDWHNLNRWLVIDRNHSFPHWSPDGQWIVFNLTEDGNLYRVRPDGQDLQAITNLSNSHTIMQDWSPDGQWLIFGAWSPSENFHLYRVNLDGSELTQLTFQDGLQQRATWTPDGNWIIYENRIRQLGTSLMDIYRMSPDGTINEQLTSGNDDRFVGFLPNGNWVYWSSREGNFDWGNLYEFDPETRNEKLLTTSGQIDIPQLSPNGQWIAFHTFEDGHDLHIARIDYSDERTLVAGEKRYNFMFWQQ